MESQAGQGGEEQHGRPEKPGRGLVASFLVQGGFVYAARIISSAHLVLPWFLASIGAPAVITALTVPFWRSARIASKLFSAAWVDRMTLLKSGIISAIVIRVVLVLGVIAALEWLEGPAAYAVLLLAAIVFGLTEGAGVLLGKRQVAKSFAKSQVGSLVSWQITVGAVVLIALLAIIALRASGDDRDAQFLLHLSLSVVVLCVALFGALLFPELRDVRERDKERQPAKPRAQPLLPDFRPFATDRWLRLYTLGSVLGVSISIAPTFFILVATERKIHDQAILLFVLGQMAGSFIGGMIWSKAGNRAMRILSIAGFVAAGLASVALLAVEVTEDLSAALVFLFAFIVSGSARAVFTTVETRCLVAAVDRGSISSYSALSSIVTAAAGIVIALALGLMADSLFVELALGGLIAMNIAGAAVWWRLAHEKSDVAKPK